MLCFFFRDIQQPRGVRLLYDVLKFDPAISRVVQFITNNALVCETSEDARYVAFDMDLNGFRPNVVSLDGTFYQKSGLISGGNLDLKCKAKCWQLNELKLQREKLTNDLSEAMRQCRQESDLKIIASQRDELTLRLKSAESDKEVIVGQIGHLERELESLTNELKQNNQRIEEVENEIEEHSWNRRIENAKEVMNNIEDEIFSNFCDRVGISNIRQYEEGELRIHQERARKRLKFENEKIRLTNELEFARSLREDNGTRDILQRWENIVRETAYELERTRLDEIERKGEVEEIVARMTQLTTTKLAKMAEINTMNTTLKKTRESLKNQANKIRNLRRLLLSAKDDLEIKKSGRYDVLRVSRMENVAIPLLQGDLAEIEENSESELYDGTNQIIIDYSPLPPRLKEIHSSDDIRETGATLSKEIDDLSSKLPNIQIPRISVRVCSTLTINGLSMIEFHKQTNKP